MALYAACSPELAPVLHFPDRQALSGWAEYCRISVECVVLSCAEFWTQEVFVLLSGIISAEAAAVQVIVTTIQYLLMRVPRSLQQSSITLIGNSVGAGNAALARRFMYLTATFCIVLIGLLIGAVAAYRGPIVAAFNLDKDGLDELAERVLTLMVSTAFMFSAFKFFLDGVLRALDMQKKTTAAPVVAYLVLGIPLGAWLTFKGDWGLYGLQVAIALSGLATVSVYLCFLFYADYEEIVRGAQERIRNETKARHGAELSSVEQLEMQSTDFSTELSCQ